MTQSNICSQHSFRNYQFAFRSTECQNCFNAAVKLGRQGKGGRGKREASPEMISAITTCSEQHLNPKYAECTTMMKDTAAEKKDTHQCYIRVLVK
jgi:hypothetical protein